LVPVAAPSSGDSIVPIPDAVAPAASPPLTSATSRGKLLQVLGVSFGIAVIIGNTILVGILRTPGDVAAHLPSTALFLCVWVLGGLYALLGTISLAEPGAMVAQSGGQYVIVRRARGSWLAGPTGSPPAAPSRSAGSCLPSTWSRWRRA
jgi:amino acid transporter